MRIKAWLSILTVCISACGHANSTNSKIVFIGDEIRNQVLTDCLKQSVCSSATITPPKNANAVITAQFSNQAKQAILVVDSKSGPLPIIREHILIARQTQVPKLSVLFADSELIDDKELMQMEVEEVQNTIETYDMKDRLTQVYYGKQGLKTLIEDSRKIPNIEKAKLTSKTKHIKASIYNMTKEELGLRLKNGSDVTVWISGQIAVAKIIAKKDIEQGENIEVELVFDKPIHTAFAERLFFQAENRIVSAGYVESMK